MFVYGLIVTTIILGVVEANLRAARVASEVGGASDGGREEPPAHDPGPDGADDFRVVPRRHILADADWLPRLAFARGTPLELTKKALGDALGHPIKGMDAPRSMPGFDPASRCTAHRKRD
jgi:hypothetical protein